MRQAHPTGCGNEEFPVTRTGCAKQVLRTGSLHKYQIPFQVSLCGSMHTCDPQSIRSSNKRALIVANGSIRRTPKYPLEKGRSEPNPWKPGRSYFCNTNPDLFCRGLLMSCFDVVDGTVIFGVTKIPSAAKKNRYRTRGIPSC